MNICKAVIEPERVEPKRVVDRVFLMAHEMRVRRKKLTGENGSSLMLDFAETRLLVDGEGLVLDDGKIVQVFAATEKLMRAKPQGDLTLAQLCWHIGNRHLPAEIRESDVLLEFDHVIQHMLQHLGAAVDELEAPFRPMHGAYHSGGNAHQHTHQHAHTHGHGHGLDGHSEHVADQGEAHSQV